jgi:hypothetical protein
LSIEEASMIQHGQVFKLKTMGPDGQPLWAYRYRIEGRRSERLQVGGFATRSEAEKALRKVLDRIGPGGGRATITLGEFVEEYLRMHDAAPVTIAKLRWLLSKATSVFGQKRLADSLLGTCTHGVSPSLRVIDSKQPRRSGRS